MNSEQADADPKTHQCPTCGNTVREDDDGYAVCYGSPPDNPHGKRVVSRPCGICGDPVQSGEICRGCATETDGDAFTTNWGGGA